MFINVFSISFWFCTTANTSSNNILNDILRSADKHPNSKVSKLIRTVEEDPSQKNIVLLLIELSEHAEYSTDFNISLRYVSVWAARHTCARRRHPMKSSFHRLLLFFCAFFPSFLSFFSIWTYLKDLALIVI